MVLVMLCALAVVVEVLSSSWFSVLGCWIEFYPICMEGYTYQVPVKDVIVHPYKDESAGTCGKKFKEHLKESSPIYCNQSTTGHTATLDNFNIVAREGQNYARMIKEYIFIRVNNPTLNGNIVKYNLSHVWDDSLFNTPELKFKNQWELPQQVHTTSVAPSRTSTHIKLGTRTFFLKTDEATLYDWQKQVKFCL